MAEFAGIQATGKSDFHVLALRQTLRQSCSYLFIITMSSRRLISRIHFVAIKQFFFPIMKSLFQQENKM